MLHWQGTKADWIIPCYLTTLFRLRRVITVEWDKENKHNGYMYEFGDRCHGLFQCTIPGWMENDVSVDGNPLEVYTGCQLNKRLGLYDTRLWANIYVYTRQSSWNPNSNTLERNRLQHDRLTACVIAQQYSSAAIVSLRFHSHDEKIRHAFKNMINSLLFCFLNRVNMKWRKAGSVCVLTSRY
jgi:hypothetical protein